MHILDQFYKFCSFSLFGINFYLLTLLFDFFTDITLSLGIFFLKILISLFSHLNTSSNFIEFEDI